METGRLQTIRCNAATMRESGEALISKIGIRKGMRVLDIGCGDGTTAIPGPLLVARIPDADIAYNFVKAGNERIKAEGVSRRFEEGDVYDLRHIKNDRFDVVVSIFGAMFASNPLEMAMEMVRVTRPVERFKNFYGATMSAFETAMKRQRSSTAK